MVKRRSRVDIASEILSICNKGAGKTKIVYATNLNFKLVKDYLDLLLEEGLLRAIGVDERVVYVTTDKGPKFLRAYKKMKGLASGLLVPRSVG